MTSIKFTGYLPIFTGFYDTVFSPDGAEEMVLDNHDEDLVWEDFEFDYEEYFGRVAESAVDFINSYLPNGITATYMKVNSPREYNFRNDSVDVTYEVTEAGYINFIKFLRDNMEAFSEFVRERYTSCSGFISFHSNDAEEWFSEIVFNEDELCEHKFSAALDFYVIQQGITTEDMYYANEEINIIDYKIIKKPI